jgi:NADH-quinone oxidoreductase subunit L
MVNAGVYLLARFFPAFESVPGWKTSVLAVGVITALMASVMGMVADDLKRVLAYSTVSQLGYMVFAIGAGSVFASQFHLFSHAIFKALLFLAAGSVIHSVGTRDMRKMGGLGRQMPIVRNVFIIGSLALAGIPILNGFWSKELILEAGIAHAPVWTVFMFIGAGLTALYTLRMVWLVFFGEQRDPLHGHDVGPAMKVALYPLAIGALISWLAVGWMTDLFHATLPFHEIHAHPIGEILLEVVSAPATYVALVVIALGGIAWWQREKLAGVQRALVFFATAAENSFGFEAINKAIVAGTEKTAELIRPLQTGQLNWNIAGILGAIIIILIAVVWGA